MYKKTPKLTNIYDKMIHPETPCNIISEWVKKITFLQWKKYLLWDFLQKVLSTQNDHKFEHNNSTVLWWVIFSYAQLNGSSASKRDSQNMLHTELQLMQINATVTKDIDRSVFCGNISDFNKYPVIQVIWKFVWNMHMHRTSFRMAA